MTTSASTTWPREAADIFDRAMVCEYASLTRDGRPVTWPVTPYVGAGGTLDVSTGLTYPDKAERARRDPRVALLYSSAEGTELDRAPIVLVQGRATVRDADLQANTDRYVRESLAKTGAGFAGMPWFLVKRLGWYFARIWVEVTPERIVWWPEGDLSRTPEVWTGPGDVAVPASDPAPTGRLPSRLAPPADWRPFADRAARLGEPVVTMVADGMPLAVRTRSAVRTEAGFDLRLPAGVQAAEGPVCLTFHRHGPAMEWQENVVLVGTATGEGDRLSVRVERALNDWSLSGNRRERNRSFLGQGRMLRKRLKAEAARRGQPVPRVRRPTSGSVRESAGA
ncbi:pyridoxamine 5'-phosphate oxidase family protein [Microtetraspora sp. AC03309]|uniref:pyridoxamine 5'-phosphate oxidase family protein n=1 Tax=Microtetraspora sp. AC03309 TaxID=2779376 RepID=UPI001E5F8D3E|nr:pyridoxamine 5'-phosphate oxidase family protein [Microtetraspora sp. AC03309]MCC5581056.1 pyridoxamine 5'-phosphate oxidase family protein [Microtetraspora sp. AC03309]